MTGDVAGAVGNVAERWRKVIANDVALLRLPLGARGARLAASDLEQLYAERRARDELRRHASHGVGAARTAPDIDSGA